MGTRGAAKHPTVPMADPTTKNDHAPMLKVLRLRSPVLYIKLSLSFQRNVQVRMVAASLSFTEHRKRSDLGGFLFSW